MKDENDGWLIAMPEYTVENPIQDLLNKEIDHSANLWGNLLLERGDFGTILGLSSVGKSVVGMQILIISKVLAL